MCACETGVHTVTHAYDLSTTVTHVHKPPKPRREPTLTPNVVTHA